MLYYNFKDYAGFKERFGMIEHGNGEKSRKNKILLAYIKQPSLFKQAVETGDYSLINIASMSELKQTDVMTRTFNTRYDSSTTLSTPASTKPTNLTECAKTVMSNVADIRIATTAEPTK